MRTRRAGPIRSVALGLLALAAAAPAADGQRQPRYQVEVSLDHTGSTSMSSVIADGPAGSFQRSQRETLRYSVGASRLARLAPRTSLRFGLSLASRGFAERTTAGTETSERQVDLLYLGAPLTLGYNLVNGRPGLMPFVEAGVVPELLVRQDESEFGLDLRDAGVSGLASFGVRYALDDGRALALGPEVRIGATDYSRDTPNTSQFQPATVGLKLAVQF